MRSSVLFLFVAANTLAGCVSSRFETAEALDTGLPDATAPATLRVGDKVRVTVFGEDKLTGEYEIDGAGLVCAGAALIADVSLAKRRQPRRSPTP